MSRDEQRAGTGPQGCGINPGCCSTFSKTVLCSQVWVLTRRCGSQDTGPSGDWGTPGTVSILWLTTMRCVWGQTACLVTPSPHPPAVSWVCFPHLSLEESPSVPGGVARWNQRDKTENPSQPVRRGRWSQGRGVYPQNTAGRSMT